MKNGEKIAYVAAALGMVGLAGYLFYRVGLGKPPVTLIPGQPVVTPDPGQGTPCTATANWSFHLRPTEILNTAGSTVYPRGTTGTVLATGTLTRNGARIYKIRVPDGREGWAFFFGHELRGTCSSTPTPGSSSTETTPVTAPVEQAGPVVAVNGNGQRS